MRNTRELVERDIKNAQLICLKESFNNGFVFAQQNKHVSEMGYEVRSTPVLELGDSVWGFSLEFQTF